MLKHGDLSELYVLLARGVRPPPSTLHPPHYQVAKELVKAVCPNKDEKTMIEFGKDRPFNDVRPPPS